VGSAPAQLLDGIATAIYTNQSAHPYAITGWKMNNLHAEANTRDLYLDNVDMGFCNVMFDMDKITIVGNNPMYIGTAIDGGGGEFSSFNWGDLHCKFRVAGPDPFVPTAEDTSAGRGIYVDGGRISDNFTGARMHEVNIGRDSGTATNVGASLTLQDTNATWAVNEWIGATLSNTTDGSTATVISNTATTITATLSGGTDDTWENGDSYTVVMNNHVTSQDAGKTKAWTLGGVHEWFGFVEFTKDASLGATTALRLRLPYFQQIDTVFNGLKVQAFAQSASTARAQVEATFVASTGNIDISAPAGVGWSTANKIHFHFRWFDL